MSIVLVMVYLLIGFLEIPKIIAKRQFKQVVIYSLAMIFSMIVSLLLFMGVDVPSPADAIEVAVMGVKQLLGGGK